MAHAEQANYCERVKTRFPDDFIGKRVLDVGSLDINGNNRWLFTDCDYTGLDLGQGKNVDIVCAVHKHSGQYDTIISTEVFEHDPHLKSSLNNIVSNLLKPGGLFIFTCAGDGRAEHGTNSKTPEDSPFTNNHYMNLSEGLVRGVIDVDSFFGESYRFEDNRKTKDLYFVGRKAGLDIQVGSFWVMPKISIVIPVIRKESAKRCVSAIKKHFPEGAFEIVTAFDEHGLGCPEMVRRLVNQTTHDLVMFLGDDTEPDPCMYDAAMTAMESLPGCWGMVGFNTQNSVPYGHWLAHKRLLEHIPGGNFFSTEYNHGYCDREMHDIAAELGRWVWVEGAKVMHHHPVNGGESDDGYKRAYDSTRMAADRRTYQRRLQERVRARGERRFGICWPITNQLTFSDFSISYATLQKPPHSFYYPTHQLQLDIDDGTGTARKPMDEIKNELVDAVLMDGITDLLTMDTDQVYRMPDMINRMLGHGKSIVAARVHRRGAPFDPIMLKLSSVTDGEQNYECMGFDLAVDAIEAGELVEVDNTGSGCVLYDTQVFLDVPAPWYEFLQRKDGSRSSADCGFHEKARAAGHRIYVDTSIDVRHLSIRGIGMSDYVLYHAMTQTLERKNGT